MSPKDLAWRIIRAWGAYSIEPELDGRIRPSDPHIVCRKCWRPKPLEQFYLARNRDGRSHCCKTCHAELYSEPAAEKRKAICAANRELRTRKCQRCGGRALVKDISRRTCPACQRDMARKLNSRLAFKAAHGGKHRAATPKYHRLQREREAAKQGRTLRDYVPREERERRTAMLRTEREADRIRKRFFAALLREFKQLALAIPEVTVQMRKRSAAQSRKNYHKDLLRSRRRTALYKATHGQRVNEHHRTRQERMEAADDGTLTVTAMRKLKVQASRCAYCDSPLSSAAEKQTDHMIALCHGGEHSRRNIVIVCRNCNARKASLTYAQWIERIEPHHRARVEGLYTERYRHLAA